MLRLPAADARGRMALPARRRRAPRQSSVERRSDGGEVASAAAGGLPLGYHRLTIEAGGSCGGDRPDRRAAGLSSPGRAAAGRAQLGPDAASSTGCAAPRNWGIGDFADLARTVPRAAGSLGAAVARHQPAACAVRRRAAPFQPVFAVEPRLARLSLHRPGRGARLCRGRSGAGAVRRANGSRRRMGRALGRAGRLRRRRRAEAPGAGGAVPRASDRASSAPMAPRQRSAQNSAHFSATAAQRCADFAIFEALHEHFAAKRAAVLLAHLAAADARPALARRSPNSPARIGDRVEFFQFLQWQADRQLARRPRPAATAGLALGLYRDLAVGVNPERRRGLGRPGAGRRRAPRSARRPTR